MTRRVAEILLAAAFLASGLLNCTSATALAAAKSRRAATIQPMTPSNIGLDTQAKHAIIIDVPTGAVLLDKAADEHMAPASMSKMMTAYIVFGYLKEGRAKLERRAAGQRAGLAHRRLEDVRAASAAGSRSRICFAA